MPVACSVVAALLAACHPASAPATGPSVARPTSSETSAPTSRSAATTAPSGGVAQAEPDGQFSMAFAGDVHFAGRTAVLLARDPATAFGASAAVLERADLTMVNLETAIAVGGRPEAKSFSFAAPPSALTALADAGVDVATMANNHGVDYGAAGLAQTLAAIRHSGFPVVGIGADAAAATRTGCWPPSGPLGRTPTW